MYQHIHGLIKSDRSCGKYGGKECIPNHNFQECSVLRGTFGFGRPLHTLGDTARAVLWQKNNPRKELFVAYVGTLQVLKAFDPGKWSICIFFEDVAPEGDDIKQPPPSAPMQPDSTLPGPDPGHGPSDLPGPPPPPDEQDDIADDESLDPGDEFGDPDLPFLPPHPPPSPIETDHLKFDHLTSTGRGG